MATPPSPALTFVTGSAGKLLEAEAFLARPVRGVALELEEIQTTALEPLVRHKTAQAFRRLGTPLLVEDTALGFAAWGGLPGPFIKQFLAALGPDGLARAVAAAGDPAAEARCGVGYHDGWRIHYFEGRTTGAIVAPRGAGGFGWDAIFQPEDAAQTFAEMTPEQKTAVSMRARALASLAAFLDGKPQG